MRAAPGSRSDARRLSVRTRRVPPPGFKVCLGAPDDPNPSAEAVRPMLARRVKLGSDDRRPTAAPWGCRKHSNGVGCQSQRDESGIGAVQAEERAACAATVHVLQPVQQSSGSAARLARANLHVPFNWQRHSRPWHAHTAAAAPVERKAAHVLKHLHKGRAGVPSSLPGATATRWQRRPDIRLRRRHLRACATVSAVQLAVGASSNQCPQGSGGHALHGTRRV